MNFKIAEKSISYGNAIKDKSFDFAIRIIKLYKYFRKNEASLDPILKQLLRSEPQLVPMFTKLKEQLQKGI